MNRPVFEQNLKWDPVSGTTGLLRATVDGVTILRIDRPAARNALSNDLFSAIAGTLATLDAEDAVAAIVLTGGRRVFAAGADIREFAGKTPDQVHALPRLDQWLGIRQVRKPLIAAVNGPALGGGCELAMACDIVVAGESATFGQPEINLGLIPGGGGTQRLIRAVGKSMAMEMILTGRLLSGREAERYGLVSRLAPDELVLDSAVQVGLEIAVRPRQAIARAKEAVLLAETTALLVGLEHERRLFEGLFDVSDTQEGLRAFLEKRKPHFSKERV